MVEFSDLQCPHCKGEAEMIRENLIRNYPTQVRLYFKDYPIESLHPVGQGRRHGRPLRVPAEARRVLGLSRLDLCPPGQPSRRRT